MTDRTTLYLSRPAASPETLARLAEAFEALPDDTPGRWERAGRLIDRHGLTLCLALTVAAGVALVMGVL